MRLPAGEYTIRPIASDDGEAYEVVGGDHNGWRIRDSLFQQDGIARKLQRYGFLVGYPGRNAAEQQEMEILRVELLAVGIDPGWNAVARLTANDEAALQETDSPPSTDVVPTRYAWYEEGSSAHGPFDTAELALADARYYFLNDPLVRTVGVGAIREIVPAHWLATDRETILQGMDEFLGDDVELIDDDIAFAVPSDMLEEADAALTEALQSWVRKYVISAMPWFVETPEWHLVGAEPDPDDDEADAGDPA